VRTVSRGLLRDKQRPDGLYVPRAAMFANQNGSDLRQGAGYRRCIREFVDAGGSCPTGDRGELPARRLRGQNLKGSLPVYLEQPTKFELVINLRREQIGLIIPQSCCMSG
jgi:hypothetical protein